MNVGFRVPSKVDTESLERTFDLHQYLNFAWRNWIFIVSVTVFVLLLGVIHLVRATPLYTATNQVLLEHESPPDLGVGKDAGIDSLSYLQDQLAILRSDSLLRRVVLKEWPPVQRPIEKELQSTDNSKEVSPSETIHNRIDVLRGALAASREREANVLNLSITWGDPARAAQLANAVADAYAVDKLDARLESARRASGWFSDRLSELRRQLSESEEAVATFRAEHGLSRNGPTVALNEQQLSNLNSQLIAARTDVAERKARVDFLADLAAGKKTLESMPDSKKKAGVDFRADLAAGKKTLESMPDSLLSQSNAITALRAKLADASQREADLLARYDSRYPAVVNVEAEKRDIQRSIIAETERMAQNFNTEYLLAKARLAALERTMGEATGQGELNYNDAVMLRELERKAAVNKALFEEFLQKAKVTDERSTFRENDVRVLVPAQTGWQSYPNSRRILLMALLAGLGLGIGGAFAMEMLKAGFTTSREVEAALGVPVLASVRKINKSQLVKDGKSIPLPFYQMHHPLSPFSEAMRSLRSGIHMSDVDQPPKVIHITSANPGEGKTTVAMSLAISAASSGLKVVLVDADLRHPASSRFFKLEKEKGLVDLMLGDATIDDVSRFHNDLNLMVIPSGSKTLNPPDVLGSERMKVLISRLRETFDYVVLDTPPIGPVVDSLILTTLADKTVLVVAWASTPREVVETAMHQISTHKRIAGVVFNNVNPSRAQKYAGGYYHGKNYEKYYSA